MNVDINLDAAIAAAQIVQEVVGHEVPSALLRAGDRLLN
ncbi:isopropylmalate/homocitrate/citramalate synthase [Mycobacteroides abscessus subsp. abscessus]|nr:Putative pyruvate carboxyltransferase [Mycobacteroides abscessus subsp. abscessus]SHO92409.1 Putative pyruvate carboxyltransferase [Mycobacteroides abscessus subsp. abscessus]SHP34084.1 Putative pyruvate carboxyltransferase [Mycobacteroides abscessus subsp. abscessus]SHP58471.1 Putative pyruvate carboxyltransferase [Mycobacteroides abscessus subsp. abscessus]SHP71944.1 Putative pyruvate carboxyltransferase [Mycobacteroides abscessus subsp. abscessus]